MLMPDDTPVQEIYDEILDLISKGSTGIVF